MGKHELQSSLYEASPPDSAWAMHGWAGDPMLRERFH
jgi:hypothetical protein